MRAPTEKQTPYFGRQTKDTFNSATLEGGTQLGQRFTVNGVTYQVVLLDSGSASPVAGEVIWWKDMSLFSVTKAIANAQVANALNMAAGVVTFAATAGYYTCIKVDGVMGCKVVNAVAAGSSLKAKSDNTLDIRVETDIAQTLGTNLVAGDGAVDSCLLHFPAVR